MTDIMFYMAESCKYAKTTNRIAKARKGKFRVVRMKDPVAFFYCEMDKTDYTILGEYGTLKEAEDIIRAKKPDMSNKSDRACRYRYHIYDHQGEIQNQFPTFMDEITVEWPMYRLKGAERAIARDPDNHVAWKLKGETLLYLGKNDEAISCLEKAYNLLSWDASAKSKVSIIVSIAYAKKDAGLLEEAISSFSRAIIVDPFNGWLWSKKAEFLWQIGKEEEAIRCTDEALSFIKNDRRLISLRRLMANKENPFLEFLFVDAEGNSILDKHGT